MNIFHYLPYEWQIGLRYNYVQRRKGLKRNGFISFISFISMAGIALGVAALIIVLSVMNGFQKEVRDSMLSMIAHIEVTHYKGGIPNWETWRDRIVQNKHVKALAPYVQGQALVLGDNMQGVVVRGILPREERSVSRVTQKTILGSFDSLTAGAFHVVIGQDLASLLGLGLGDKLTLVVPAGQMTPAGMMPRLKVFKITGIFSSGHFEYDRGVVFIHLDDAEKVFHQYAPNGLRLVVDDLLSAPLIAHTLSQSWDDSGLIFRDWSQQNKPYFAAVKIEKRMMFIILMLIIAVAAFNLVSTLVMSVRDKQADIAILRTLGASPLSIMKIFMVQGGMIGLLGTCLGVCLGVLGAWYVPDIVHAIEKLFGIQFLDKTLYFITQLPSQLDWYDVILVGTMALLFALFSTLYPSYRAANIHPAQALRYE